jgi:hypothetical protein
VIDIQNYYQQEMDLIFYGMLYIGQVLLMFGLHQSVTLNHLYITLYY